MSCSEFDWKAYVLNETSPEERRRMESHLPDCASCREEVEELGLTMTVLRRMPDQPVPRRIAFVSDPVVQLSWWQKLWVSGPRLGFASAALLAAAIVAHGALTRPAGAGYPGPAEARMQAQVDARVQAEVARRLPAAVDARIKAELHPVLDELSGRLAKEQDAKLDRVAQRLAAERHTDQLVVQNAFDVLERRLNVDRLTLARYGGD